MADVSTNDFGVLVMPMNRREARDADRKELGSEEEKTALLHSQDRQQEHTAQSFKARFLHPDHQRETRRSIRENPASRGTETSAEDLVGPPGRMVSNSTYLPSKR